MHLDLKPENMMYFSSGPKGELVLKAIDFGTSKVLKQRDLSSHELNNRANLCQNIHDKVGSFGFTSPEIRFKCDEFSWEQSFGWNKCQMKVCNVKKCEEMDSEK